jgi:putative transposase
LRGSHFGALSHYMMVEAFAQIDKEEIDPILSITTKAA